jgi:hypothetical protein
MFCLVFNNVPIMWMCYVCVPIYEVGMHIPKPKEVHGICRQKPILLSNRLIFVSNFSVT